MSKTYGTAIDVCEPEKKPRRKIMAINTDSQPVEAPKNPETSNIFALYKLFASREQQAALATRYRAGGMGYGEAKQALFELAMDHFATARRKREKLAADVETIEGILRDGARRARDKGAE